MIKEWLKNREKMQNELVHGAWVSAEVCHSCRRIHVVGTKAHENIILHGCCQGCGTTVFDRMIVRPKYKRKHEHDFSQWTYESWDSVQREKAEEKKQTKDKT